MHKPILFACNFIPRITRPISTTPTNYLIQAYRKQKGQPMNPNAYGPLTDLPDYSYLDGRPTPLGMNQRKRMQKQKAIAERIITLSKEIDFAVERHEEMVRDEQRIKEDILNNKLKPKGHLLLKDAKWNVK